MQMLTFLSMPDIPVYFEKQASKKVKLSGEEYKGNRYGLRIEPFTAAMAADLSPELKTVLFNRTGAGELKRLFSLCRLDMEFKGGYRIEVRPDPTLEPSVVLTDVKILSTPLLRATAEGRHLLMRFSIEIPVMGKDELHYMNNAVTEQRFLMIEPMQRSLYETHEMAKRKNSKDAVPVRPARHRDEEEEDPELEEVHH